MSAIFGARGKYLRGECRGFTARCAAGRNELPDNILDRFIHAAAPVSGTE